MLKLLTIGFKEGRKTAAIIQDELISQNMRNRDRLITANDPEIGGIIIKHRFITGLGFWTGALTGIFQRPTPSVTKLRQ